MSNQLEDVKSKSNKLGDRLREEVQRVGGASQAVDVIKAARATLYNWFESGLIPATELEALAGIGVDVRYVVTGQRDIAALATRNYERLAEFVMSPEARTVRVQLGGAEHQVSIDDYRMVPVLAVRVSAGDGAVLGGENIIGWNAYRKDWLAARRLSDAVLSEVSVTGDSMSPELRKGDTVLVNHSDARVQDGGIYVLRQGENLLVKYLQGLPGDRIQVSSEATQAYPPYVIEAADFESGECEIIGRVVRQGRDR